MFESTQQDKLHTVGAYVSDMLLSSRSSAQTLRIIVSFFSGALSVLAYAPFHIWILAPLTLACPLLLSQRHKLTHNSLIWFAFGLGKFFIGSNWLRVSMIEYGDLPLYVALLLLLVFNAYQALYPMLAGWLLQRLNPLGMYKITLMIFPVIWCFTEWLRGELLTGFPWLWDGYVFVGSPFIHLAPYIGALGLTGISALIAALLFSIISTKQYKIPLIISCTLGFCTLLGYMLNPIENTGERVHVALVQGNTPQSIKWNPSYLKPSLDTQATLSEAYWDKADLIIWSESALATSEKRIQSYLYRMDRIAKKHDVGLITGITQHKNHKTYNGILVLGNYEKEGVEQEGYHDNNANRYQKAHLLPIGEYVPFEDLLRPIAPFFNLPMSNFYAGDAKQNQLKAAGYTILPKICYEIAFAEALRANFDDTTQILLTISNDTWFGRSIGPAQHMQIAQMRAAEFGRPLLRGTNSGITASVNAKGEIIKQAPVDQSTVLYGEIELTQGRTLFSYGGHSMILFICCLIFGWYYYLYRVRNQG